MAEMLQCVAASASDLSVLEQQTARLQWQQQPQQSLNYITNTNLVNDFGGEALLSFPLSQNAHHPGGIQPSCERELLGGLGLRWPDLSSAGYPTLGIGQGEYIGTMMTGKDQSLEAPATQRGNPSPKQSCSNTSSSLKKRKADNPPVTKTEDCSAEKRMKGTDQQAMMPEPKLKAEQTNNTKRETSGESLKENSKTSAPSKTDYIHVRARRGQATDSHSLAERVRREKISERMRYLQDLVPGCNKITGKAGMLEEIINYVQSLQRQVEFLSMKLAAVNPSLDFNTDSFIGKEMNPSCSTGIWTVGMSCNLINPSYLQLNSLQQTAACCGINMAMTPQELVLPRSMKAPVPVPDTFVDPSLNVMAQGASSAWDIDLQSLYNMELHQGNRPAFPLQSFHGSLLPNNPKMEM